MPRILEMSGCVPALLAWYAKAAAVFPLYCTNEFALGPLVAVWRLLGVVRQSGLLFFFFTKAPTTLVQL